MPVTIRLADNRTFIIRALVIIGFLTFRGGLFMTSRSTGSTPRLQRKEDNGHPHVQKVWIPKHTFCREGNVGKRCREGMRSVGKSVVG